VCWWCVSDRGWSLGVGANFVFSCVTTNWVYQTEKAIWCNCFVNIMHVLTLPIHLAGFSKATESLSDSRWCRFVVRMVVASWFPSMGSISPTTYVTLHESVVKYLKFILLDGANLRIVCYITVSNLLWGQQYCHSSLFIMHNVVWTYPFWFSSVAVQRKHFYSKGRNNLNS